MVEATKGDYERRLALAVPRERAFDAIATVEGVRRWWTPDANGSAELGGKLELEFAGLGERIVLHVQRVDRPTLVEWTCEASDGHPEWEGTTIRFELAESGPDACELRFRHVGLVPELRCYEVCERGWDSFLGSSLVGYLERGQGAPFQAPRTPLGIVRSYHRAWTLRNYEGAARFLAPDLETDLPLNEYAGREDFLVALAGFGAVVERVQLLAEFENGDEALLLYDLDVDGVGPLRIAEHFTVADGRITRIRMVNDTAELRKAGFAA